MTLNSYKSLFVNPFYGNPNRTITSIDESGGIVSPRTSGSVPFCIHVSASAILASGTDRPYEDLSYSWNFGDAGSTETLTNPGVGGGTVNSNSDQRGPEAVHWYTSPGTYTITLTIYGYNVSGLKKKTVTQQVIVSAFTAAAEYWLDSVGGSDSNNGLTISTPKQTIAAINTLSANAPSQTGIYIKRNSTFDGSVGLKPWASVSATRSGLRVDAYGSGSIPVINISSGSEYGFTINNGGGSSPRPKDDVVVSNIRCTNSGTATVGNVVFNGNSHASAAMLDCYFRSVETDLGQDNANAVNIAISGTNMQRCGQWKCSKTGSQTRTFSNMGGLHNLAAWYYDIGGTYEGGTYVSGSTLDHHTYPGVQYHSLHRWIDFQQGTNRNYCINMNWDHKGIDLPEITQYHLIADSNISGTLRGHDMGEQLNRPDYTRFRSVVCQGNRIHGMGGDGAFFFGCGETWTFRDNEAWGNDGDLDGFGNFIAPAMALQGILKARIYRNKYYRSSGTGEFASFPSASWTQLQEITDNIIQDMRTAATIVSVPFAQQAGAFINRNQFYAPNDSNSKFLKDSTTDKSFAEWQAAGFDTNGSVADPGWTDAANGDFS